MKSIWQKLLIILLYPIKFLLRLCFKIGHKVKNISPADILREISRTGETILKFIYIVGYRVENAVKDTFIGSYKLFINTLKFIYLTGEVVNRVTKKTVRILVKAIMLLPKSFVKDFAYWAPAIGCIAVIAFFYSTRIYTLALKVTVNGTVVGYVSNENEFSDVARKAETTIEKKMESHDNIAQNYVMASTPEYSFAVVKRDTLEQTEIYDNVYSIACEEVGEHYGLYVDGNLIAASETKETFDTILEELKAPYKTEDTTESVEFVADVKIKKSIYSQSEFLTEDQIRAKFSSSTNPRYYTIQEDDYLSDISKATGLSKAQLYALNPELDERRLVPGKKVNISQPEVYLGIKIVKTITYNEDIAFATKKINDNSLYKTQTKVKTQGKKGEKEVVAQITYIDGAQTEKNILKETVLREPVTKEIYVGTKALPVTTSPLAGTGTYIRPISGGYTSCGYRGYRGHKGVDLTMHGAYGKPVYASASGTVISAGWSGGYGKMVKIRHSNGSITLYAHLSSIDVSNGQTVYQGQQIGRIGSTGNSTGPHLHFELYINGSEVNPMKYIG